MSGVDDLPDAAAAQRYKAAADGGDAHSQVKYGDCLENGWSVPTDFVAASDYFKLAADQGDSEGQWKFGLWLTRQPCAPHDNSRAASYFKLSSDQSNAEGQYYYGDCLMHGRGVRRDVDMAVDLFRQSAAQGSANGEYAYGSCLLEGVGVGQDAERAAEYIRLALEHGGQDVQLRESRRVNSVGPTPVKLLSGLDVKSYWRDPFHFKAAELAGYKVSKVTSVGQLVPITLREMQVPFRHSGKCLICRTITKFRESVVVVEDTNGDSLVLSLYLFLNEDPNDSFPPGTVVLIKEPSLRLSFDGISYIDVKSPSDAVVVHPSNGKILDGTPFHRRCTLCLKSRTARGNLYFRQNQFRDALVWYDLGLELAPGSVKLQLKKAQVFAAMGRNFEAYESAKHALADRYYERALTIVGESAYKMQMWDVAIGHFQELCEMFPSEFAADELVRSEQRLRESQTGDYDMDVVVLATNAAVLNKSHVCFDLADYIGPMRIADIPGKGKGLIAITDIGRGTLIMAEKAFAVGWEEDGRSYHENYFGKLIRAIQDNPQRHEQFYSMYCGADYDRNERLPVGVVDVGRIHMISSLNSFAWGDNELFVPLGADYTNLIPNGTGLPIMACFGNHSCLYNTESLQFGDMMFFICCRDIRCNEEITISYNRDTHDSRYSLAVHSRQSMCHWFPVCDCGLCDAVTNHRNTIRIQQILAIAETAIVSEDDLQLRIQLYEELTQLYADYPGRPFLDQFGLMIGSKLHEIHDASKASKYYELAMRGSGRLGPRVIAAFSGIQLALEIGNRRYAAKILSETYDIIRKFIELKFKTFIILYKPLIKRFCPLRKQERKRFTQEARSLWMASTRQSNRLREQP
jgi:tetratricopeptide (TPR) repeat protein